MGCYHASFTWVRRLLDRKRLDAAKSCYGTRLLSTAGGLGTTNSCVVDSTVSAHLRAAGSKRFATARASKMPNRKSHVFCGHVLLSCTVSCQPLSTILLTLASLVVPRQAATIELAIFQRCLCISRLDQASSYSESHDVQ